MPIDSGNLALKGLDDLFSTEEKRQEEQREQVQQIPIDALHRSMRLATRCNGTMTSFGIIPTGRSLTAISTRASPEPPPKSARPL